jgi:hypothetical protein
MKEVEVMGIYLGQLPPAEVARLKAELAETIIANFCYPRFFDYRTDSLRMRPVDRNKRQEVWLYLSSVDFTAWNRIDLMSNDFQRSIERLFIQFVQRNRSFFGEQGRKRMPDVRMLITSTSTTVVQGLRNHVTGQRQDRQGLPSFGSPRQAISWATQGKGHSELAWEQIATTTTLLQQQLQEIRGEIRSPQVNDGPAVSPSPSRRSSRAASTRVEQSSISAPRQATPTGRATTQRIAPNGTAPLQESKGTEPLNPNVAPNGVTQRQPTPIAPAASMAPPTPAPVQKPERMPPATPVADISVTAMPKKSSDISSVATAGSVASAVTTLPPLNAAPVAASTENNNGVAQTTTPTLPIPTAPATMGKRESAILPVGDEDIAIFEQLRHQLVIWLRIEAIHLGLDITDQSPPRLLELLSQQEKYDETRLQVVSTLLNLANQVIKNGRVSVLDYKQALMFHLMHTKR